MNICNNRISNNLIPYRRPIMFELLIVLILLTCFIFISFLTKGAVYFMLLSAVVVYLLRGVRHQFRLLGEIKPRA